jgi:hypothetical protein
VSSAEPDTNSLGDYSIYAGSFGGTTFYGVLQFDLTGVPLDRPLLAASLSMWGLAADRMRPYGRWQVELAVIRPTLVLTDSQAITLTYYDVERGHVQDLLEPAVLADHLDRGARSTFWLTERGRQSLRSHVGAGKVNFRLIGPRSSDDNVFGWDAGSAPDGPGLAPRLELSLGPQGVAPPTPTPDWVITTLEPTPANVVTAAARALTATALVRSVGTPTPLPPHWVTPLVVYHTSTPGNAATAQWRRLVATAEALLTGTPTSLPHNVVYLPPPQAATPLIEPLGPAQLGGPTATPGSIPGALRGKILFRSDMLGKETVVLMNPDGSGLARLTDNWPFRLAEAQQAMSPDGRSTVVVRLLGAGSQLYQVHVSSGQEFNLTRYLNGHNYDPAWSPDGSLIAFASSDPGNDEIMVVRPGTTEVTRLTRNSWEWDKHPTWSPDSQRIVFWSNREHGRGQVWVMNRDGTAPERLRSSPFNDTDPVWVRP